MKLITQEMEILQLTSEILKTHAKYKPKLLVVFLKCFG